MITPGQFFRVLSIQRVLIRHGLDELLFTTPILRSLRFLLYLLPWNWFRGEHGPRAVRIRMVLEQLGPIFIKFGQILSTRRDFLPDDIAEELSQLQDNVPPFPGKQARAIIEKAYGCAVSEVFDNFDENPLASASIAQVHTASLKDGRQVIVKVVRPNIKLTIGRDIGLMRILANTAERYSSQGRELNLLGVVDEFEKTIIDELDMMREAANASQLRRNFSGSAQMYVPEVVWSLTHQNVMVMERVSGIEIDKIDELRKTGVDLHQLAETGVDVFFTQVFRDHFFHADIHPGNLFIKPGENGAPAMYIPVDFGIMGSLSEFDQRYLAENFSAFLDRNYRRVAELHVESGWVPKDTRVDEFEFAIRTVCEPIFDRPVKDISVGALLLRLFQTARRFHMKILPQLLLLQKTIVNVEGIGRQLDPDLDLWRAARPSLEAWMRDRVGLRSVLRSTRQNVPLWIDRLPELPGLTFEILDQIRSGRIQVVSDDPQLRQIRREIARIHQRIVLAVVGVGLMIGAGVLNGVSAETSRMIGPLPLGVWVLGGIGIVAVIAALRNKKTSGL
ncbi:MAG TPA: ubiquinone biosynthesis regulatory protein kinase UbiB [Gammaproteobacteria bacterium]|nr:ubiquinone biosynthesis regulatory protein kinase UbiB [Gammaproteobacteria bacterium]